MVERIQIIKASLSDAKLLSDLSISTFNETFRGICPEEDIEVFVKNSFLEIQITKELESNPNQYYIGFVDSYPAGYMRVAECFPTFPEKNILRSLELKRIYVLKEFQRKKVGARLMSFALKLAKENSCEAVWLGVWEDNVQGIDFYNNFGFQDTGFREGFQIGRVHQMDLRMMKFIK